MTRAAVLAVLLLAGCATPKMTDFENACYGEPFQNFGRCVEGQLNEQYPSWRRDQHADLAQVYVAWLIAAGERVERGEMTEAEAVLGKSQLYMRMKEIAGQRAYNAALTQQAAMAQMLTGLALISASQPQPAMGGLIICNSTPMGGGLVTTVCH